METTDGTSGGEETTGDSNETLSTSTTDPSTTSTSTSTTTSGTDTDPTGDPACVELTVDELFGADIGTPAVVNQAIDIGDASIVDVFRIEFYDDEPGTFDLSAAPEDNYATCNKCIRILEDFDGENPPARQYFQSEGTLEVAATPLPSTYEPDLTFAGVRLVEVTVDEDYNTTPVDGGACIDIVDANVAAEIAAETCDDGMDDNEFGLADCGDLTCVDDPACTTPCAAATEASVGDNAGDTTGGGDVFQTNCNATGGLEDLWTFTPAADGLVLISLASETDQGLAIREACSDISTELACADDAEAGEEESIGFIGTNGTEVTIIVDGYGAGEEGAYTLNVAVPTLDEETETNDAFGEADALANDGFTATLEAGGEDWFSVTVNAGSNTIRARTFGQATGCDGDTIIEIFAPDGTTVLETNDDASLSTLCSDASVAAVADGTYFVRITSFDEDATFDYSLVIQAN